MSRKKRVKEEIKGGNDAFVIMSTIMDKLQIADYEDEFLTTHEFAPLNDGYFAYPLKSAAAQFSYFAALCDWLFESNDHSFEKWNSFDDPNSISNNILNECKKLGFHSEFAAVKLTQGSGVEVCQILDFLLNLLLKKIRYEPMEPIYHKPTLRVKKQMQNDSQALNNNNNNNNNNENKNDFESQSVTASEDGSMAEDIIDSDNDSEYQKLDGNNNPFDVSNMDSLYQSNNKENSMMNGNNMNDENEHKTTMSVMHTSVLPSEWKLEIERVSHRLNEKYFNVGVKDWILHLNKAKLHSKTLNQLWPQCENKLEKSEQSLNKLLNRLSDKESTLNHEFSNLKSEYTTEYNKLTKLTSEHNQYLEKVGHLTSMLQDLNQQIQNIKQEMENRNNAMTDMSPIRRLKEMHNQLKQEIIQLDTKIGVTRHALQHARMRYETTYSAR